MSVGQTEKKVVLTVNDCAALLSAAKTVLEAYDNNSPEAMSEPHLALVSAAKKIAAGMGFGEEKTKELLQFMGIQAAPNHHSWMGIFK